MKPGAPLGSGQLPCFDSIASRALTIPFQDPAAECQVNGPPSMQAEVTANEYSAGPQWSAFKISHGVIDTPTRKQWLENWFALH